MKKSYVVKIVFLIIITVFRTCKAVNFRAHIGPTVDASISLEKNYIPAEHLWNFLKKNAQKKNVQNTVGAFAAAILIDALADHIINNPTNSYKAWDSNLSLIMLLFCTIGGTTLPLASPKNKYEGMGTILGIGLTCSIIECLLRSEKPKNIENKERTRIEKNKKSKFLRHLLQVFTRNAGTGAISYLLAQI